MPSSPTRLDPNVTLTSQLPTEPSGRPSTSDGRRSPNAPALSGATADPCEWDALIRSLCNKLAGYWGPSFGIDDAMQEGRLAAMEALDDWDPSRSSMTLKAWIGGCVHRRLLSLCREREWRKFDRSMVSLDDEVSAGVRPGGTQETVRRGDTVPASLEWDPWERYCRKDRQETIWGRFASRLTPFERDVFRLWAEAGSGQRDTYVRIMDELGCNKKQIDNALRRVKQKMQNDPDLRELAEELTR